MNTDDGRTQVSSLPELLERSDSKMSQDFWNQLFTPLREAAITKFQKFGFCRADAEEGADEVILRVYKHFDFKQFEGLSPDERCQRFHAFVRKTAYSVFVERLRQRGIPQAPSVSPERVAGAKLPTPTLLSAALAKLTAEQQQLLRYKFVEELTYAQMQDKYKQHGQQIRLAAIKMRTRRAVLALRRIVAGSAEES